MAGPQKTARQKILLSEKEAAAGRASSSPGSGQSKFKSGEGAGQVTVQAAGRASRASSNPGSWQSRFESRNRQISSVVSRLDTVQRTYHGLLFLHRVGSGIVDCTLKERSSYSWLGPGGVWYSAGIITVFGKTDLYCS